MKVARFSSLVSSLLYNFMASAFLIGARLIYNIRVKGLENYSRSPSTLIVVNHKRDSDVLIIAPTLYLGNIFMKRVGFVAREDLFVPGFLYWYAHPPRPIDRWVWPINLKGVMKALCAYPVRRIPERLVIEVLREVYTREGDLKLESALSEQWLEKFRALSKSDKTTDLTLAQALGWRYRSLLERKGGLMMLNMAYQKKFKDIQTQVIEGQLNLFAQILGEGGILLMMPEGALSTDGSFSRIRDGLHQIVSRAKTSVRLLPVNITYDFMTTARMTVFLNIGQEIRDVKGLPRLALDSRTRNAILKLHTITLGNLASQEIIKKAHENGVVDELELAFRLFSEAQKCSAQGFLVDERLLREQTFRRRFEELIGYCVGKGIMAPAGRYLRINPSKVLNTQSKGHLLSPVGYSYNEYLSWRSEAAGNNKAFPG